MSLTIKQERFCQKYIELDGNATESYKQSYDGSRMSDNAIGVEAHRLLENPKISLRINQLKEDLRRVHEITVGKLLGELEEARVAAMTAERPQTAAAINATMGKAKLCGLDKLVVDHVSSDGSMSRSIAADMSPAEAAEVYKKMMSQ